MLTSTSNTSELRHINKLRYWPLESVLHDKYLFPKLDFDAAGVGAWGSGRRRGCRRHPRLLPDPHAPSPPRQTRKSNRPHSSQLAGERRCPGEIDVIRRAEQDEAEKRKILEAARESSRSKSERDAMKPVEESIINRDDDGDEEEEEDDAGGGVRVAERGLARKAPLLAARPAPTSAGAKENTSGLTRAMKGANATPPRGKGKVESKQVSTSAGSKRRTSKHCLA
ncbi:hypothetical protein B0H34DRAFT_803208 [Crassisporium funariophilum]|nr:hypothetical protein B0H34DRAFT_803208 [Crassisporium funariophilum]